MKKNKNFEFYVLTKLTLLYKITILDFVNIFTSK
jgi:hypothetical protein